MRGLAFFAAVAATGVLSALAARAAWSAEVAEDARIREAVERYGAGAAPSARAAEEVALEDGFWVRGGPCWLRTKLLLLARYEGFAPPRAASERLSDFAAPRPLLAGHARPPAAEAFLVVGLAWARGPGPAPSGRRLEPPSPPAPLALDALEEAWIQWGGLSFPSVRFGRVSVPTPRHLVVPLERQPLPSRVPLAGGPDGVLASPGPGVREAGLTLRGRVGRAGAWAWTVSVAGPAEEALGASRQDVHATDGLAYGARVRFAPLAGATLREDAFPSATGGVSLLFGAWALYADETRGRLSLAERERLRWGLDTTVGLGSLTLIAAISWSADESVVQALREERAALLIEGGYRLRGTPWAVAARYRGYGTYGGAEQDGVAHEVSAAVHHFLDGSGSRVRVDVSWLRAEDDGFLILDAYGGADPSLVADEEEALLLRLQWQLFL